MRLTLVLICCMILQATASSYSQTTRLNVNIENGTLQDLFKDIKEQSEFTFVYNVDDIEKLDNISCSFSETTVEGILNECLEGTNMTYEVRDKVIIIVPDDTPKIEESEDVPLPQTKEIKGNVSDENGGPIPGVSVVVKGTTVGIITDIDGNYVLEVPVNAEVLQFSFVGMKLQEVPIGEKTEINIVMEVETIGLEEVVTIGYGVQKKRDVTGAISQVKSEDLHNRSTLRAEQALQGKTAGVQVVNTSGAPGSGGTIRVRGISSNNASEPLYVVDGLIVPNIGNIDPNDIESMEILKDAASAAIYGVASGNGVIIVTTKKGKPGQGRISYDFQYMTTELPKSPGLLDANEYVTYMTEGSFLTQDVIDAYWDGTTNTDWMNEAFETGITQRHNLSFTGGNERGTFYLSMSYSDQDGIVAGDHDVHERISGVFNADYKIKDWLKVGTTNNVEKYEMQTVSEGSEYDGLLGATLTMDPLTPVSYTLDNMPDYMRGVYDAGVFKLLGDNNGNYWAWSDVNVQDQTNPFIMRDQTTSTMSGFNLNGTVYADLMPIEGLTITSKLGYRFGYNSNYAYESSYYGNAITQREKLVVRRSNATFNRYQWDNYATYLKDINEHSFNVMAGVSYIQPYSNTVGGSVNEIEKDNPLYQDIDYQTASAIKTINGSENLTGRLFSLFGRVNYSYAGKYLFQASVRRDAGDSNYFPKGNNIGVFPAASVGWVISQEDFFTTDIINHLKLRGSWGQNGTYAHLNGFLWRASIASVGSYPYTEDLAYQIGAAPNRLQNPDLTWETTEQTNFGVDLRALDSRFTLTAEWYVKNSKDLLVTITPPYETGQSSATINAGDVRNSGLELELGWRETKGDFTYGIQANLATLDNEVTYLDPTISRISGTNMHTQQALTVFEEGYPVWYMRGFEYEGVNPADGEPIFTDQNGDGAIDDADKVMLGSGIPDITYGITLSAEYKGFDLNVFGTGQAGNDIYFCFTRADRPNSNKFKYFYDDRWTPSNTEASTPKPGANGTINYYYSSGVVFDGSFFKIKQIQLGYTVPSRLTKKAQISNLRVYMSMDDWFTFTDYIGYDPETSVNAGNALGVDKGNYPLPKKLLFGVNITF